MSPTEQQQIGALIADVANLKDVMADAHDDRKAMAADISEIKELLAEARGYWKMGLMIAGFSGALMSFVTWVLSGFPGIPKH
jgi:hypothetical protein